MSAKKTVPPDFMDRFMQGKSAPPEASASAPPSPTPEDELVRFGLWIPKSWKSALERHFKAQGLDMSNGVRQVLAKWMREEGVR